MDGQCVAHGVRMARPGWEETFGVNVLAAEFARLWTARMLRMARVW